MVSVLLAVAVLAAIGVVLAIDPGGAIAESGFPDFGDMDWKQLTAWGFRAIGVVLAQLLIIVLWLWPKYRPPRASPWYSGTSRPGSMPAAVVSVLEGHAIGNPTQLASIIEMSQRGTLRIEAVGSRVGFLYRLSRQGPPQYDWEGTICDSLPSRATTIDALRDAIDIREDAIGDQIGEYLQQRGLFDDNPVRVRRENNDDGSQWTMVATILTGVGSGFWAAIWLDQWWANALIGGFAGLVYSFFAAQMTVPTGMLKPTPAGAHEISQWLGLKESIAGSALPGTRDHSDSMLPYAVAFNVAQPWLDAAASAPPWFGSDRASALQSSDLDAAYRGFIHAQEWWLTGRSSDAAKAAAGPDYELELEILELEELDAELAKGGGCLPGCIIWMVGLVGIGALVMVALLSLDVVSPRDKPCPLDSPGIPPPGPLSAAGDLIHDECVSVNGTVAYQDIDELLVETDRGEYVQPVSVRGPEEVFEAIAVGDELVLAGRLKVEEDRTYAVHFEPDLGSDRSWWRNLRENLKGLF